MTERLIITTINDIVRMMADYTGPDDIPPDSQALKLQYLPTERGKLAIVIDSPSLTSSTPIEVRFDLRRNFLVGGS